MVETFEHLIRRAATQPRQPRAKLYRELLRSETFLLTLDEPMKEATASKVSRANETFPIWADKDPELGGVWVPVFPSRDAVAAYVAARKLVAPAGKEFLWMSHRPGTVFGLLRSVHGFAGVRLFLEPELATTLFWSEVAALADGRAPADAPRVYELPVAKLSLPEGARVGSGEPPLLCVAEAGHFRPEDARKRVRLPLEKGEAWMPCRHFVQVLRYVRSGEAGEAESRYVDDLLRSLVSFEMYGEAEALCEWLAARGHERYAWLGLAAIYAKTLRFDDCAEICAQGAAKHSDEPAFPLNGARALRRLDRREEAEKLLAAALERFPDDEELRLAYRELVPAARAR